MLRAFSTLGCPDATLAQVLSLAERHHIDAVELRALADTTNLPSHLMAEFGTPEVFAAELARSRVKVFALDTSLHLSGGSESEREQFLAFLPWAEAAGVRWLRVFDGRGRLAEKAALAEAVDSVSWWRELRHERKIKADISVETHDMLFTGETIRRFLDAAPGTALLWDSHHTWRKGGENPLVTWRGIREHVVHVHVKDSTGVPSARHPFTYVLPGDGEFPIAPLLKALRADKFAGPVSLEWEKMWHSDLPPLEDALRVAEERRWW